MRSVHASWTARRWPGTAAPCALLALQVAHAACPARDAWAASGATLASHIDVEGAPVADAEWRHGSAAWKSVRWEALGQARLEPGPYDVRIRFLVDGDDAVFLPACADRRSVSLDGRKIAEGPAPLTSRLSSGWHEATLAFVVGRYEHRVACGEPPRVGHAVRTLEGLGLLRFDSPEASRGGGQAVVYVPPGHDIRHPGPLLVGTHPWNGSIWTYAAYAELLREARTRDVLLLMPSGLGNSLYTEAAEEEVLRAMGALETVAAVDPQAISIWGASMGGAGATTIGFHHPDRFASVTSFFGDSRYDLSTYVRAVLHDEAGAHRVNALDVVDNARELPVWLVHGQDDRTSPIEQSRELAEALRQRGFQVRWDAIPGAGHEGALVARFLPELVALAARARVPDDIAHVTYRSVRPSDLGAYGVHLERSERSGDAFVELVREPGAVRILRADGVRSLALEPGALETDPAHPPPLVVDSAAGTVRASWGPTP